jgi:hypothetical protein
MSLLNLILPMHTRLAKAVSTEGHKGNEAQPFAPSVPFCEQSPHLARFEPWLLGLRNMIEEGDWHNAQVFADQIKTRLRHLELAERCDAEGVVRR